MTEQPTRIRNRGKGILPNLEEEERAGAALDSEATRTEIHKQGHRGIITIVEGAKMECTTEQRAAYIEPPKGPVVRQKGIRRELLEKEIAERVREEFYARQNLSSPKIDYRTTTKRDFCAGGFVPASPQTTLVRDYKTDQAISFWSENYKQIQGVTAVQDPRVPFRRSARFSTPIGERLDEVELPPNNRDSMSGCHMTSLH